MNRRALLLSATLALVGAAGCAEDRASLEAYAICSVPDTCEFSSVCELYLMGQVVYYSDSAFPNGPNWLSFPVEMHNQLPNNADQATGRVNTNDAHVTGVRLEIEGPDSGNITFDVGHHVIPAAGTGLVWTYALPPDVPTGSYVVGIVYIGYYDNGREFETPPFPVAVQVVNAPTPFGCVSPEVVSCGSAMSNIFACAEP